MKRLNTPAVLAAVFFAMSLAGSSSAQVKEIDSFYNKLLAECKSHAKSQECRNAVTADSYAFSLEYAKLVQGSYIAQLTGNIRMACAVTGGSKAFVKAGAKSIVVLSAGKDFFTAKSLSAYASDIAKTGKNCARM